MLDKKYTQKKKLSIRKLQKMLNEAWKYYPMYVYSQMWFISYYPRSNKNFLEV